MGNRTSAPPSEPGLEALRFAYTPYRVLVYTPFFAATTAAFGCAAIVLGSIDERLAHHCGTAWAWTNCRANFTKVTVSGRHNADPTQSYIIMSNHMSHFDVIAFLGHWGRQFRWVIKQELRRVPFLGRGCAKAGYIFIDRSNRAAAIASLQKAQARLKPGVSVMLFPEGTRSRDGTMGEFKKGGFMMALDMGLPILPVTISGSAKVLPGGSNKLLPGTIQIKVHEPIDTCSYGHDRREELMADVREVIASGLTEAERG